MFPRYFSVGERFNASESVKGQKTTNVALPPPQFDSIMEWTCRQTLEGLAGTLSRSCKTPPRYFRALITVLIWLERERISRHLS